jgi:predicted transcriptional regulator
MSSQGHNRNRSRIRGIVELAPGIHLRELQRVANVSFSTARYHTARLAKEGEIEFFPYHGKLKLFPRGFSDSDKALVSAAGGERARLVLREIEGEGPTSNKAISNSTGLSKGTVSKYISLFVKSGIIRKSIQSGGRERYSLARIGPIVELTKLSREGLRSAVDNYTELWDF